MPKRPICAYTGEQRVQLRRLRAAVGVSGRAYPFYVVPGPLPPARQGEPPYYTTPGGNRIHYPNAYHYNKVYHASTVHIAVGLRWLYDNGYACLIDSCWWALHVGLKPSAPLEVTLDRMEELCYGQSDA